MITIDVARRGLVAIDEDDEDARYAMVDRRQRSQPAKPAPYPVRAVRALVEVQRRVGGMAPRALLGGQFAPNAGHETVFEVWTSGRWEDQVGGTCRSRLWKQPFVVGLPVEFVDGVIRGLTEQSDPDLPPGILTVDRAGFDVVESSTAVFAQAAGVLRRTLRATLLGCDVEAEVRALMETW